ncbi:hypothetical protein RchiOBHm_Chr3g0465251 [Rosa chinensis]|uniref:Uncharacterized protein n=1 Tax=Rosa chinensis TaxID=74649 RepID=A0A2P6R9Q8_ROSCH|nr:hypothetical protein RchiOBHm_Chr3g0465251 [Rosa chinensis]
MSKPNLHPLILSFKQTNTTHIFFFCFPFSDQRHTAALGGLLPFHSSPSISLIFFIFLVSIWRISRSSFKGIITKSTTPPF